MYNIVMIIVSSTLQ